jgi:hypothetical protein
MKKKLAANEVMFSEGNEIHFTTTPDYHINIRTGIPSDVVYSILSVGGRYRLHTNSPGVTANIYPIGVSNRVAHVLQGKAVPHVDPAYTDLPYYY